MASVEFDYDEETVVVTGASSGIGRAIATRFGEAGAAVINADVRPDPKDVDAETPTHEAIVEAGGTAEYVECDVSDPDDLETVVTAAREFGGVDVMVNNAAIHVGGGFLETDVRPDPKDVDAETQTHEAIVEAGGTAEYVECDVSDPDDLETVVTAAREFGGVDVMVNNAAIHVGGGFLDADVTAEEFDHLHAVNVRGVYAGTRLAARDMVERGEPGCIVNTASVSSTQAQWENAPYESTKGAVRMLTRAGALNLAEHGIRVNAIAPGHIATEFFEGLTDLQQRKAREGDFIKPVPLERPGFPEDLDDAVLFLASDAASYVTGELFHVDGGWHAI